MAIPPLKTRVTDITGTLTDGQLAGLEAKLWDFEKRKGSQVAVLIVPTTQPEAIEQYSIRVFDQWKLGRKGVDDGILLLVAKDDRKLRIEVGRDLEGVIPDAIAKRIIVEAIAPRLPGRRFLRRDHRGRGSHHALDIEVTVAVEASEEPVAVFARPVPQLSTFAVPSDQNRLAEIIPLAPTSPTPCPQPLHIRKPPVLQQWNYVGQAVPCGSRGGHT